jgi:hydroxymethylbilane synthase
MSGTVRIATRGSALALWQAHWVAARLEERGVRSELVIVETQGDRDHAPFSELRGQGFFTKAVQDALLLKRAFVEGLAKRRDTRADCRRDSRA